jgi:hypothetical protein
MSASTLTAAAAVATNGDDDDDEAAAAAVAIGNSNSNSNSTTMNHHHHPTIVVDAALLRRALRLVYCLQKERGASCCYYASGKSNTNNNATTMDPLLSSSVLPARRDTDCAWNMMVACSTTSTSLPPRGDNHHHHHHHHRRSDSFQSLYAIQAPLAKIRKMVENGSSSGGGGGTEEGGSEQQQRTTGGGGGFHKIFACFNTLISSVVHEYLLLQTAHQRQHLLRKIKGGGSSSTRHHHHKAIVRSHSSSNDPFAQPSPQQKEQQPHTAEPVSILRNGNKSSHEQVEEPPPPPQHNKNSQHRRNLSEEGISYFSAMVGSLMLGVDDVDDAAPPPPPPPPASGSSSQGDHGDNCSDDDDDGVPIVLSDDDKNELAPSHPFEHFQQQHLNETAAGSSPNQNLNRRSKSYSPSARNATSRKQCVAGGGVVSPMRRIDSGDIDVPGALENDDDFAQQQRPCENNVKQKNVSLQQGEEESPEEKVVHLLDLLDIFIKLKESTGIERATLTSLLAAANAAAANAKNSTHHHQHHDDNDTQFLLADLVLQVENQRSLLQRLRQLRNSQGGSGSLKNLVHDLVSLSPRLAQLQHDLLQGGGGGDAIMSSGHVHHGHGADGVTTTNAIMETVLGASLTENNSNQWWDLLTVYIDKLHSLELLIVEEIECSAAYWMTPLPSSASSLAASATAASPSLFPQPQAMMMMNNNSPIRKRRKSPPHSMLPDAPPPPTDMTAASSSINNDVHVVCKKSFGCEFANDTEFLDHVQSLDPYEIKRLLVTGLQQQVRVENGTSTNIDQQPDSGGAYSESSSSSSTRSLSSKLLPLANDNHDRHNSNGHRVVKEGSGSEESPANRIDDLLKELCHAPSSKEWEIDLYQIRFLKRIGQGSAGTTYLGDWGGTNVAVKVASITEMGLDGWRKEVQALQKLHHPNIIRLLGSVYHPSPLTFCLVLEYCNAGDLSDALLKPTPSEFWSHVAISIAKGITYLHHRGIIHVSKGICRYLKLL